MCEPSGAKIRVINRNPRQELVVAEVVVDTNQLALHYALRHHPRPPIHIKPGKRITMRASFTPAVLGEIKSLIYFRFSGGRTLVYKVKAYATENRYGVRPVFRSGLVVGEAVDIPIAISNPVSDAYLRITCIQCFDDRVELKFSDPSMIRDLCKKNSSSQYISVPPLRRETVVTVRYTPLVAGTSVTRVIILGKGIMISVPVIMQTQVIISPRKLDFGVLPLGAKPHVLQVFLDSPVQDIAIQGLFYKPNPDMKIVLKRFPKAFRVGSARHHKLGYVVFCATRPGTYHGQIYIQTNATGMFVLEYSAEVVPQTVFMAAGGVGVVTDRDAYVDAELPIAATRAFTKGAVAAVTRLESSERQVEFAGKCASHNRKLKLSADIASCIPLFTKKGQNMSLGVRYRMLKSEYLPIKTCVTLLATQKLYSIPVSLFDTAVYCSYSFRSGNSSQPCSRMREIDIGSFGETARFSLNVTYPGEGVSTLSGFRFNDTSAACFGRVTIHSLSTQQTDLVGLDAPVSIDSDSVLTIGLTVSPSVCGSQTENPVDDGTYISSELSFHIGAVKHAILLRSRYWAGELRFHPAEVDFAPGFYGLVQSSALYVNSTFSVPIRIISARSTNRRTHLETVAPTIRPQKSLQRIGAVVFDPTEGPELSMDFATLSPGVTLRDFVAWSLCRSLWKSPEGEFYIQSSIEVETDLVQTLSIMVKARLEYPWLSEERKIDFELTQRGAQSEGKINIYNPSSRPLQVRLMLVGHGFGTGNVVSSGEKCRAALNHTYERRRVEYCCNEAVESSNVPRGCKDLVVEDPVSETEIAEEPLPTSEKSVWWRRILCLFWSGQCRPAAQPRSHTKSAPTFSFSDPATGSVLIPPGGRLPSKRIVFAPSTAGTHEATLYIKNNLTAFQPVRLTGRCGTGVLEFSESINRYLSQREQLHITEGGEPIPFSIAPADVLIRAPTLPKKGVMPLLRGIYELLQIAGMATRATHERIYIMRNTGELPIVVKGISVAGRGCEAYGIRIVNCEGFALRPGESGTLLVQYRVSGALTEISKHIIFRTQYGEQAFRLRVTIGSEALTLVHRYTSDRE